MLRLNTIHAQPGANHKRKRLGRGAGSGLGQTAGKGDKGQLARSGGTSRPGFEGGQTPLYRRIPKRGFTSVSRRKIAILNLSDLERMDLPEISLESLMAANQVKGQYDRLVILGTGDVSRAFSIKAHKVTASAQEKISKAGGKFEIISIPVPRGKKQKRNREKQKS